MSKSSSLLRKRRPENLVQELKRNIKQVQTTVHQFNKRQQDLPNWVQSINRFYREGQSTQLKKLTEPKYVLMFQQQKQNPKIEKSSIFKKVPKQTSLMLSKVNRSKMYGFKNVSTVSKILKTEMSENQTEINQTQRLTFQKTIQLQGEWEKIDRFRQTYMINSCSMRNKNKKVDKILDKISSNRPKSSILNPQYQTPRKHKVLLKFFTKTEQKPWPKNRAISVI